MNYNTGECSAEDDELVERHQDEMRNIIINRTSSDLEQIINGHDPDIDNLGNRVWDRLDMMACEIEARHATTLFVLQARAEKAECELDALGAAVREIKEAWVWWREDSYDRCSSVVEDAIIAADAKLKGDV